MQSLKNVIEQIRRKTEKKYLNVVERVKLSKKVEMSYSLPLLSSEPFVSERKTR